MEGGASRESDFEGQHAMSQEFHRSERNRNSTLGGHQESSVHQNLGEKESKRSVLFIVVYIFTH